MTKTEEDTDPSTPRSKRTSDPAIPLARAATRAMVGAMVAASERPPKPQDATDPGLGPSGSRAPLSKRAASVVVPPAMAAPPFRPIPRGNDSVDVLLDGIAEQPVRRVRTTPQTAGQSAATYHAQHGLHAARTNADTEPLVVVEAASSSVREKRPSPREHRPGHSSAENDGREGPASEPAVLDPKPSARSTEGPSPKSLEVTPVFLEPSWPRVAVAVGAGVLVVVAIALMLRSTSGAPPIPGGRTADALDVPSRPVAKAPSAAVPSTAFPPQAPPSAEPAVPTARVLPSPALLGTSPVEAPSDDTLPPRSPRARVGTRYKPTASSSAAPPDLGEFKLTY